MKMKYWLVFREFLHRGTWGEYSRNQKLIIDLIISRYRVDRPKKNLYIEKRIIINNDLGKEDLEWTGV